MAPMRQFHGTNEPENSGMGGIRRSIGMTTVWASVSRSGSEEFVRKL
jgi:hypothetical protein